MMDALQTDDVPYGDDWDNPDVVAHWVMSADQKRPWRAPIRDYLAGMVATLPECARILELGAGPGFLAERVLDRCPGIESYTLMDFSEHMLEISRQRLKAFPAASFVLASFKSPDWTRRIRGPFDGVLAMQSVHELRNKRHAVRLYKQIYEVLSPAGMFAICDHLPLDDSPSSTALYMTENEQQEALATAGFSNVRVGLSLNRLVVYAGERAKAASV